MLINIILDFELTSAQVPQSSMDQFVRKLSEVIATGNACRRNYKIEGKSYFVGARADLVVM